jgi:predicted permease
MAGDCDNVFSYPMFRDLQRVQNVFTGIAAHRVFSANLAARGQTLSGRALLVSGSYFPVLGLKPAIGRLLSEEDDRAIGQSPVVVLSHSCWENRFGRDPNILGQAMIVNGMSLTIIGVAPRDFRGTTLGNPPQAFVPITLRDTMEQGFSGFDNRRSYWAYLFARLTPGVSVEQARAALGAQYHTIINDVEAVLQKGMSEQTLARFRQKPILIEQEPRGQSSLHREAKAPLVLLLSVTAFVVIIACANVANLLLARGAARASEMAIRLSIGAGRRQLVGQLLTESLLLALFGGAAGLLAARWTLVMIASLLPPEAVATLEFHLDNMVLMFTAALTLLTGLLFGLFPALHSTRPDLVSSLKGQAGQPSGARSAARFRTALATAQIAISMTLLIAAGLFLKSLFNVSRVDLGIKVEKVVTFGVSPALNGYTSERSRQLFARLEEELGALPGVNGVTACLVPLLAGSNWGNDVSVEGFPAGPDTDSNSRYNLIGPDYCRVLGVPVLSGREFTQSDALGTPKVAIVNEAFAKKFNLGRNAVGKRIGSRGGELDTEIVGLAQNAKYSDVKDAVPPLFFRPYRQEEQLRYLTFYVRTASDPDSLLATIPGLVARLDPNLPVEDMKTLPQQVEENVFMDRMITTLSAAFASLATLLAAVGLYGVLAYTVAQRTREIGLRMALGAAPGRVQKMILRQVALMTLVGSLAGLVGAIWIGGLAQSLLYELKGSDATVLSCSIAALVAVALGSGLIPAYRASKVDPMQALRYE